METSREDIGIAIRSAFLSKGTQQKFSLLALMLLSVVLLFIETIEIKPLNYLRFFLKDSIYRGSTVVSLPSEAFRSVMLTAEDHMNLYKQNIELRKKNSLLEEKIYNTSFLVLENEQLRKLLVDHEISSNNIISSRVMINKKSPYLNSFVISSGRNKKIKNGMAALDGKYFVGRIIDVNFFSSRVLLITDLNSRIPVIIEPKGYHAIMAGNGTPNPILEFLPKNHNIKVGNKVFTSGKEGIFLPGIPIGKIKIVSEKISLSLFSDINQITFISINLENLKKQNK
jgi:rod shape-determining protein MreC